MKENEAKEEETKKKTEKPGKTVVMACCPEVEDLVEPEMLKEKVLVKLRENLGDRGNVVMTRLDDDDLKKVDALVEVEVFKSRSEAAAFFIKEGMRAREDLFQKIMPTVEKIRELKGQAKQSLIKKEEKQ